MRWAQRTGFVAKRGIASSPRTSDRAGNCKRGFVLRLARGLAALVIASFVFCGQVTPTRAANDVNACLSVVFDGVNTVADAAGAIKNLAQCPQYLTPPYEYYFDGLVALVTALDAGGKLGTVGDGDACRAAIDQAGVVAIGQALINGPLAPLLALLSSDEQQKLNNLLAQASSSPEVTQQLKQLLQGIPFVSDLVDALDCACGVATDAIKIAQNQGKTVQDAVGCTNFAEQCVENPGACALGIFTSIGEDLEKAPGWVWGQIKAGWQDVKGAVCGVADLVACNACGTDDPGDPNVVSCTDASTPLVSPNSGPVSTSTGVYYSPITNQACYCPSPMVMQLMSIPGYGVLTSPVTTSCSNKASGVDFYPRYQCVCPNPGEVELVPGTGICGCPAGSCKSSGSLACAAPPDDLVQQTAAGTGGRHGDQCIECGSDMCFDGKDCHAAPEISCPDDNTYPAPPAQGVAMTACNFKCVAPLDLGCTTGCPYGSRPQKVKGQTQCVPITDQCVGGVAGTLAPFQATNTCTVTQATCSCNDPNAEPAMQNAQLDGDQYFACVCKSGYESKWNGPCKLITHCANDWQQANDDGQCVDICPKGWTWPTGGTPPAGPPTTGPGTIKGAATSQGATQSDVPPGCLRCDASLTTRNNVCVACAAGSSPDGNGGCSNFCAGDQRYQSLTPAKHNAKKASSGANATTFGPSGVGAYRCIACGKGRKTDPDDPSKCTNICKPGQKFTTTLLGGSGAHGNVGTKQAEKITIKTGCEDCPSGKTDPNDPTKCWTRRYPGLGITTRTPKGSRPKGDGHQIGQTSRPSGSGQTIILPKDTDRPKKSAVQCPPRMMPNSRGTGCIPMLDLDDGIGGSSGPGGIRGGGRAR